MSEEYEKTIDLQSLKFFRDEIGDKVEPRFSLRKTDYGSVSELDLSLTNPPAGTRFNISVVYYDNEKQRSVLIYRDFYSPYIPQHFSKLLKLESLDAVIRELDDLISAWDEELP